MKVRCVKSMLGDIFNNLIVCSAAKYLKILEERKTEIFAFHIRILPTHNTKF